LSVYPKVKVFLVVHFLFEFWTGLRWTYAFPKTPFVDFGPLSTLYTFRQSWRQRTTNSLRLVGERRTVYSVPTEIHFKSNKLKNFKIGNMHTRKTPHTPRFQGHYNCYLIVSVAHYDKNLFMWWPATNDRYVFLKIKLL